MKLVRLRALFQCLERCSFLPFCSRVCLDVARTGIAGSVQAQLVIPNSLLHFGRGEIFASGDDVDVMDLHFNDTHGMGSCIA